MKHAISLRVNGILQRLEVEPHHSLLDVLERHCGVRRRETCGIGMCGTCTVLVDGKAMSSCLVLAPLAGGTEVLTIEGLARNGRLDIVQEAFIDEMGFQCGYCTPGMVLAAHSLLRESPAPTTEEIRHYLAGNLCRCGSYEKILAAVHTAARRLAAQSTEVKKK